MRITQRSGGRVGVLAAVALGTALALTPQTGIAQSAPGMDAMTRLKGSWQFNAALSSKWPEVPGPSTDGRGAGRGNAPKKEDPPPRETDEMIQVRVAMREVNPTPQMLFIKTSPTEVSFTTDDGTVRTFVTDGQPQPMTISSARMQVRTSWSPALLSQDLVAGPVKLSRTWGVSDSGTQLIINLRVVGAYSRNDSVPMKFIYDRMQ